MPMLTFTFTLLATMAVGIALRFDLASPWLSEVGLGFTDLRHAHSHIGFFGTFTVAWWLTIKRLAPALPPRPRTQQIYLSLVTLTSIIFAFKGYVIATMALSTIIAFYWMQTSWRVARSPQLRRDPLSLGPWGVLIAVVLIPIIAVMARINFQLSRDLAHVFIGLMVLLTFSPAAWSTLGLRTLNLPAYGILISLGTARIIFSEPLQTPLSPELAAAGVILFHGFHRSDLTGPLRWAWQGIALGIIGMGLIPALQDEGIRLMALHAVVLGPLTFTFLVTLGPRFPRRATPLLGLTLAALAAMLAGMFFGPLLGWTQAFPLAAWSSLAFFLGMSALLFLWIRPKHQRTEPPPT